MNNYPSNQAKKQWQVIKNIVEPQESSEKFSSRFEIKPSHGQPLPGEGHLIFNISILSFNNTE